ncbi:Zn-dependent peptidase, insulinase family [Clostridium botulinum D str. 1873]|uniref:Zn-dependent peptidase, insulinase family n=1 Tax=Clostridium botulinum D str. 1873 TaxID=592027 RepID=A0A9P2G8Z7_CLOBO|nr:insulinase family protein [Clostridium botulinum]EES92195.1 Zn-dependent peptidase, insulinase family [Clostridium botulinum D str. 1873]
MNIRLKAKIVLALVSIMTCQTLALQKPVLVSAVESNSKLVSSVKENKSLGGFELVTKKYIKALNCNSYEYKHTKTGARLIFIDNKEQEKMFCVSFRTPTKDSTGVNHIIEHSVLQGSKNYPVKDPFIQMSKQSLNTFLNAMTLPDYTMYPVSSKNDKDFNNLMSVYLDAVFYPNVTKDKRIFKEQGWRYELKSKDSELKYNGIVYNEMRGRTSDPEQVMTQSIGKSLFPDTIYKNQAGGNPENIPNLTYEEFVNTYKKYYTPSNSYFYLSGNLNIEKTLKFIGEKYLNNFNKVEVDSSIPLQKPFTERKTQIYEYPVSKGTPIKNKSILTFNYVINRKDFRDFLGVFKLLTGDSTAKINEDMKKNGFNCRIVSIPNIFYQQPVFTIAIYNTNEKDKEKIRTIIDNVFKDVVKNGFDSKSVNSIISQYEIEKKKKDKFQVDVWNRIIMSSWLYDGEPTFYLEDDVSDLQNKIKNGELQNLVQKYLINNNHASVVVLKPSPGLQEKKDIQLKEKLANIKKSLSDNEINNLVKETNELKIWQSTPNTKEQLNKLPTLNREDILKDIKKVKTIEKNENEIKVLYHPLFTNGVDKTSLYFDTSKVPQDKLKYMYLLSRILQNVDTKNYKKEELSKYIDNIGIGLSINNVVFVDSKNNNIYYPKMNVSFLSLSKNIGKNFDIAKEVIFNSKLDDTKELKNLIGKLKSQFEQGILSNGKGVAFDKFLSYISEFGKYENYLSEDFYKFICDLNNNFDSKSKDVIKNLEEVRDIIFNKNNMIASYTGEEKDYKNFADNFNEFSKILKDKKLQSQEYKFDDSKVNEGIITPLKVQYILKGGNLNQLGYKNIGKFKVLNTILSSGYLWDNIRAKGGAYGPLALTYEGNILFGSHEDPNLKETIDVIDKIPQYLSKFNADEKEMTNYIIGTIGEMDKIDMDNPYMVSAIGDKMYIKNQTQSDIQKQREEILSTTAEDIRNFAKVVDAVLKQDYLCVVGGDAKIKENEKEFMSIKNVLDMDNKKDLTMTMEKKENVPVDKSFKVNFSKELDELTVNTSNVYVLDDKNHKVDVEVSYDKKNKAVQVKSKNNYESGKKYTLFIKGIQSVIKDGKVVKLVAPIKMEFTVK